MLCFFAGDLWQKFNVLIYKTFHYSRFRKRQRFFDLRQSLCPVSSRIFLQVKAKGVGLPTYVFDFKSLF